MNIFGHLSLLLVTYQMKDFDKVEEKLVNREVKLRTKVEP